MKKTNKLFAILLAVLMLLQWVPMAVMAADAGAATEAEDVSSVSVKPSALVWVSARKPDVALSAGSSTLRINGDAHDENLLLATFLGSQVAGKDRLSLCLPVANDAAETVVVSVIDNYAVDPATTTYNTVKARLADATVICEQTLTAGDNALDISALIGMSLSDTFTLVIRSKATGEEDNVHSYFYDFEDYAVSSSDAFFANPGSNSKKIGYLDGSTTNSFFWRGANTDSNQNSIVTDPTDTTGESRVISNWIGGTYKSSGRLRPFDAMSHDKLTSEDIGKTYRFSLRILIDNANGDATAKLSMGYAEASSMSFKMTLSDKAIAQSDGWQTYSIDYTVVDDDIPPEGSETRTNGDRMFVLRINGGTAEVPVNWYLDDMSVVQLDANGKELCAVVEGITMEAEFRGAASPVATGYVSSALPSTKLGGHEQAVISGDADDLCISYLTFRTDALGSGKYAVLGLPGHVEGTQTVDIFLIDGYTVDETDLDWDKRYTLENCPLIATCELSESSKTLVFDNPRADITGEYFTLALCSRTSHSNYALRVDFEDFGEGDTVTVTTVDSVLPYSDTYLFRSGGGMTHGKAETVNANKTFTYKTNADWNRFKIYNSFSDTALVSDDVGTYRVSFRAKADVDTSIDVGVMSAKGTYSQSFYGTPETVALAADTWTEVELDVALTQAMIDQSDSPVGMVTVNYSAGSVTTWFDDFSIVKLDENGNVTAPIARITADDITLRTLDANQPLADVTLWENGQTDNGTELTLKSATGDHAIVAVSYLTEALRAHTNLVIPASGTAQSVTVLAVDGVNVGDSPLTYEGAKALFADAVSVGCYTLGTAPVKIDLSSVKSVLEGECFTLLFVAESQWSSLQDFESITTSHIRGSTPPPYNRCYSDSFLISAGGSGITTADIGTYADKDGGTSGMFHYNGYGRRYKFFNTVSDDELTAADIGRKYRISFDIMSSAATSSLYVSLKCAINGNGTTTGPADGGYSMNTAHTKTPFDTEKGVWKNVWFDVTVDQDMVDHQVGLVTIDFAISTAMDIYVDNLRVEEIGGNAEGTVSTLCSIEGDGLGLALTGEGFIDVNEVVLDASTKVLEAAVALTAPDSESSTSDIFRIFNAEKDYTLLSAENDTGNLFFTVGQTAYRLCDGKGELYTLSDTPRTVTAIYDNTAGTVRYAVDGKLAYYTDGETVAMTYGLTLVEGGHVGAATVAGFTRYGDISMSLTVSDIEADAPRFVGTQTNVVGDALRVIAGLDVRAYSKVGFILEREGKRTLSWSNDYVFTSVNAAGDAVTAEELGCEYLSCFVFTDLDSAVTGESVRIIPVAYVGNQAIKGDPVTLEFTVENGTVTAAVDTTAPDLEGYRTFTMAEAEGYYRPLGRVKTVGTALACDWSATGAEFVVKGDGDVTVYFDAQGSKGQYLTSFVDGVKYKDFVLTAGENAYVVAEDLPEGTHTVRVVAQYAKKTGTLNAVKFRGELAAAQLSDTYVEIIGDSITCGALLSPSNSDYATAAYAYVAMSALDSDYAICSRGGQPLSVPSRASTFYQKFNDGRDSTLYTPTRQADIIIVNLIVNDNWQWYKQNNNVVDETGTWSYANFDAGVAEFFETLEGIHDMENTPILFVFGCNTTEKSKNFTALNRLKTLFDEIYYDKYDLKTVTLTGDASASDGGHPCAEAAQLQGEELTAFLLENYPHIFGEE